jgi:alpha 1,3-glucosidase
MRAGLLLAFALFQQLLAVKEHDFKKCQQSGFCKRGRALAERALAAGASWRSPYSIDSSSLTFSSTGASFTAPVKSDLYPDVKFELRVSILKNGVTRIQMDEVDGLRKRYNEASSWSLVSDPELKGASEVKWTAIGSIGRRAMFDGVVLHVGFSPLHISLSRDGRQEVLLNSRGLLHMEHFRTKPSVTHPEDDSQNAQAVVEEPSSKARPTAWFEGESEESYWEETFGSWTDSKPKGLPFTLMLPIHSFADLLVLGPEALSLDIDFPNHGHIFGIPQHAAPLSLPDTTGSAAVYSEPFRLYNGDIFEYPASSSDLSLYGSIPLLHAQSVDSTVGVFNALASETWIDVHHQNEGKSTATHWISESGVLDVFLLPGPTPVDVLKQYAHLTGTSAMPAHWALGHHQCRWNYISSDDVRSVSKRFDDEDMPVDVIWLDIEYSEEHKYFIWDKPHFPDPVDMMNDVAAVGRKVGYALHAV